MAELGTSGSGGENPDPATSGPDDPGQGDLENTSGASAAWLSFAAILRGLDLEMNSPRDAEEFT
jgi:hypothetical protein